VSAGKREGRNTYKGVRGSALFMGGICWLLGVNKTRSKTLHYFTHLFLGDAQAHGEIDDLRERAERERE